MTTNSIDQDFDSQPSTSTTIKFSCSNCPQSKVKVCDSLRGLKIHNTKCHPNSPPLIIPNIDGVSPSNVNVTEEDFLKLFGLKSKVGVLRRIPKGARPQAANTFVQLIRNCIAFNDLPSWLQLFTFSYKAFHIPVQNKKDKARSLVSLVKENITSMQLPPDHASKLKSADFFKRVETKLSDFDVRGAVRLLSSDDSFAPLNVETLNLLRAKHPQPTVPITFPPAPTSTDECLQVSADQVKKAIMSFASGSAAGPDGLRPQFLKDMISISAGNAGTDAVLAITDLSNFMLRGDVNKIVCQYLYGASLCALCKKCGGIRPIAIGLSIRRLTSKLACSHAKEVIGDYFGSKQLGFGVRCGCEAAVHATRSFVTKSSNTRKVTVKIDYVNAYNTVRREATLSSVKAKTPLLYKYFWQCYANPTKLCYDTNIIISADGIQQGDPGGSFLFPVGLKINPSKCELHFSSGHIDRNIVRKFESLAPGIRVIDNENFNLLGAPILESGFENFSKVILEKVSLLFVRLKNLPAHSAYFLLKNCFAIPKLTYLIRSSPAWLHKNFIDVFDSNIKDTLESILNIRMDNKVWTQATLPTSYGGLGIRRLKDIVLPAFLSSVHGSIRLVSQILHSSDENIICFMREASEAWNILNDSTPTSRNHQHDWDKINSARIIRDELNFTSTLDIARFKALQCKESNAWINAIPSKHIGTFMDNNFVRICMALRIGAPICRPHICLCGTSVTELGIHGLSCQKSAGRWSRHVELNKILCQALTSIFYHATLEPPGLFRDDGKRPDGLTLVPWSNGRYLVWDATCWDTLAPSHLSISARKAGRTAELAARTKHNKYMELKANNYIFNAFAVETLGPWSTEALNLINKIGQMLNEISGDSHSHEYLTQRISFAIQRANATSIMRTIPSSTPLDQIFYL